jgi:hypothetical protein
VLLHGDPECRVTVTLRALTDSLISSNNLLIYRHVVEYFLIKKNFICLGEFRFPSIYF